ncbi:hypothetical protein P167DRAFT_536512 [Morchella conica CCBAS932]|uniref:Uncharacterized protein n=1 Tax=Morchella conica CCBAS932 TaxID=1392247 RepID=A0A3N4KLX3_9PEZI|nr:hypothetical protein P167DRAFT_536512 [Morchella conica CCBAS932]
MVRNEVQWPACGILSCSFPGFIAQDGGQKTVGFSFFLSVGFLPPNPSPPISQQFREKR